MRPSARIGRYALWAQSPASTALTWGATSAAEAASSEGVEVEIRLSANSRPASAVLTSPAHARSAHQGVDKHY